MSKTSVVSRCLNCGQPVPRRFCGSCGQRRTPIKLPVWKYLAHIVGEHLLFDSRMARSVVPFLVRPGVLTREYNEGRRVRYSAPIRIYLLTSLLLFLTLGMGRVVSDLAVAQQLAELQGTDAPPAPSAEMLLETAGVADLDVQDVMMGRAGTYDLRISQTITDWFGPAHPVSIYVETRMLKLRSMDWAEARLAGFDNWLNLLPTAMFFLLPLFAALLRLCYLGSGRYYVEHLVFAVHLHAFIYLVLLLQSLFWTKQTILGGLVLVALYILIGLRTAYRGTWAGTVLRGVPFLLLYGVGLLAGLGATFWLSLLLI